MRKFENIKPLNLRSPLTREISKFTPGGKFLKIGDKYYDPTGKLITREEYYAGIGMQSPPTTEEITAAVLSGLQDPSKIADQMKVEGNSFMERLALRKAKRELRNEALDITKQGLEEGENLSFGTRAGATMKNVGSYIAGAADGLNQGMKAIGNSKALAVGTAAASMLNPGPQTDLQSDADINAGLDAAANIAGMMGPYGKIAEFGIKGLQAVGNMVAGNMKPKFSVDRDLLARLGASYADTFKQVEKLSQGPGIRGIFGSGEWRNKWQDAQAQYELTKDIDNRGQDAAAAGRYEGIGLQNEMALNGGYTSLRAAKHGMKVANLKFAKAIKMLFGSKMPIIRLNEYLAPQPVQIDFSVPLKLSSRPTTPLDAYAVEDLQDSIKELTPTTLSTFITNQYGTMLTDVDIRAMVEDIFEQNPELAKLFNKMNAESQQMVIKSLAPQYLNENSPFRLNSASSTGGHVTVDNKYVPSSALVLNVTDIGAQNLGYEGIEYPLLFGYYHDGLNVFAPDSTYLRAYNLYELASADNSYNDDEITDYLDGHENELENGDLSFISDDSWLGKVIKYVTDHKLFNKATTGLHFATKKEDGGTIELLENGFVFRPKFKEGGSFNVIPDGALHKNKHHMEDAEGLTKKGIPVVTEEAGGELVQQAEIELNEIIFRLEVTNKLEKLAKEGTDEAAIEAGKLLVKEILHNTHDNTGLIDEISI